MPFNQKFLTHIEQNDPTITKVHLRTEEALTPADIKELVEAMKRGKNTHIKALILPDNEIGDEGAALIATLENIEVLGLEGNNIGAEGARHLAQMKSLKELGLSGNSVGDQGAGYLAENRSLEQLELNENNITNVGAKAFLNHKQLKLLFLDDNTIDLDLIERIQTQIKANAAVPSSVSSSHTSFFASSVPTPELKPAISPESLRKVQHLRQLIDAEIRTLPDGDQRKAIEMLKDSLSIPPSSPSLITI